MAKEKYLQECTAVFGYQGKLSRCFLLFRMGDFTNYFTRMLLKVAQILEISLTSRNKNADNPIPMVVFLIIQLNPILMSWLRWATR